MRFFRVFYVIRKIAARFSTEKPRHLRASKLNLLLFLNRWTLNHQLVIFWKTFFKTPKRRLQRTAFMDLHANSGIENGVSRTFQFLFAMTFAGSVPESRTIDRSGGIELTSITLTPAFFKIPTLCSTIDLFFGSIDHEVVLMIGTRSL
ncbi:hypothetical protein ACOME3_005727 [Neoechinorhynchus agilis]